VRRPATWLLRRRRGNQGGTRDGATHDWACSAVVRQDCTLGLTSRRRPGARLRTGRRLRGVEHPARELHRVRRAWDPASGAVIFQGGVTTFGALPPRTLDSGAHPILRSSPPKAGWHRSRFPNPAKLTIGGPCSGRPRSAPGRADYAKDARRSPNSSMPPV